MLWQRVAVEVLTRYMAKELGPRGITANVGGIETEFSGAMLRDNPAINKMVAGMAVLGRAGVPDDIRPTIAALLSDDNPLGECPEDRSVRRDGDLIQNSGPHYSIHT